MQPDVYPEAHHDALEEQIAAFNRERSRMEEEFSDKWVVFSGGHFWRAFDTFQDAAVVADRELGDRVKLIRQVGAPTEVQLPSSLLELDEQS